jgi:hypothetical protein
MCVTSRRATGSQAQYRVPSWDKGPTVRVHHRMQSRAKIIHVIREDSKPSAASGVGSAPFPYLGANESHSG